MTLDFNTKYKTERETCLFVPEGKKPKTQRQLFYFQYYQFFKKFIIPELPPNPKILEIGCGRGTICHYFREYHKFYDFYLLDNSQEGLNLAKKNLKCQYLYLAEANDLPFDDNSFDLVFSMGVVEHVDDYKTFYKEQYRVLKKGGIMASFNIPKKKSIQILNVFGKDHYYRTSTTKEDYKNVCEEIGFTNIRLMNVTPLPLLTPIPRVWEYWVTLLYRIIIGLRRIFMFYPFKGSRLLCQSHFIYGKRS